MSVAAGSRLVIVQAEVPVKKVGEKDPLNENGKHWPLMPGPIMTAPGLYHNGVINITDPYDLYRTSPNHC
jgi:hypothetical protein